MKKLTNKAVSLTNKVITGIKKTAAGFIKNEAGETNVVAILLIIVVTVALVAIFKDKITDLVNTIFDKIGKEVAKI